MRYHINFNKLVNRFVPHYIGGRKLILFLQSTLAPLQILNESWVEWAKEMRIEASMTSQVFKFEWFLNRKFKKYLSNNSDRISISHGEPLGVPIYHEDATGVEDMLLYSQEESGVESEVLHRQYETTDITSHSFAVSVPAIDTNKISQNDFDSILRYWIDKYKLSGKTYIIIYNQ